MQCPGCVHEAAKLGVGPDRIQVVIGVKEVEPVTVTQRRRQELKRLELEEGWIWSEAVRERRTKVPRSDTSPLGAESCDES